MAKTYDQGIVCTRLSTPGKISRVEADRVSQSIRVNGLAVLPNFVGQDAAAAMRQAARSSCDHGYDVGSGVPFAPVRSASTLEFRHPYLVSKHAVDFVTNEALLALLETHLGNQPVIHNALFQISLPSTKLGLDYHIDCGSVKALNPERKFADYRLRTILYLSDVQSGGFSYILGTAEAALKVFLPLPYSQLMPAEAVPTDPERRIVVNQPAGTLVVFNTHGLHRPEITKHERVVLNTWFARNDFSGNLPPTLFSMKMVDPAQYHRLHVFASERGCSLKTGPCALPEPSGLFRRVAKKISKLCAKPEAVQAYEG